MVAVNLLLPHIPMLFMGEEWNTSRPFQYFCDFEGELGDKVRKGRRDEFASFPDFADPAKRNEIPDPQAESTFLAAKLDWEAVDHADCRNWLDLYTALLALRQKRIVPLLARMQGIRPLTRWWAPELSGSAGPLRTGSAWSSSPTCRSAL